MRRISPCHLLAALLAVIVAPALADEVQLANRGTVQAEILGGATGQSKTEQLVLKTPLGGRLVLSSPAVKSITPVSALQAAYRGRWATIRDTAEDHWELAQWCLHRGLHAEREHHLRRIVAIEPDHQAARAALGYQWIRGEWITRAAWFARQGMRLFEGEWLPEIEIARLEKKRAREAAEKGWTARLKKLRQAADGSAAAATRLAEQLATVTDRLASAGLTELLASEPRRDVRLAIIAALGRLEDGAGVNTLTMASVLATDEEARWGAIEELRRLKPAGLTEVYARFLKHPEPRIINQAAIALGELGDESATGPLIDALITQHTFWQRGSPGGDPITTSFATGPGGGGAQLNAGQRTEVQSFISRNDAVLAALVRLSAGHSFGYDRQAWKAWQAARQSRDPGIEARRSGD